jgi:hypothetical protein
MDQTVGSLSELMQKPLFNVTHTKNVLISLNVTANCTKPRLTLVLMILIFACALSSANPYLSAAVADAAP